MKNLNIVELLKTNIVSYIIPVNDRNKYFEFLKNAATTACSGYLENLSKEEMKRIERFA